MEIIKISDFTDINPLPEAGMIEVKINQQNIILYRTSERMFAFASKCPHGGTLLCEGYVDAKNCIVCPTHFYKFQLTTGKEIFGREYRLKTYKTFLKDGEWYVEM